MPKTIGHITISAPIIIDRASDQEAAAVMEVSLDHAYLERIDRQEHPEEF